VSLDTRPSGGKDALTEWVDFDLRDRFDADSFAGKINASNTREERQMIHADHPSSYRPLIGCTLTSRGVGP
jgi:hypothetical protein